MASEEVRYRLSPRIAELVREARERRQARAVPIVHVAAAVAARDAVELFRRRHRQGLHRCSCAACSSPPRD